MRVGVHMCVHGCICVCIIYMYVCVHVCVCVCQSLGIEARLSDLVLTTEPSHQPIYDHTVLSHCTNEFICSKASPCTHIRQVIFKIYVK